VCDCGSFLGIMVLEKLPRARCIAATVVPLCWMACSSGLILLNKELMIDKGADDV
jgi:hypothetical protein